MKKSYLFIAAALLLAVGNPSARALDIIRPGDPIIPIDTTANITTGSNSPGAEGVANILDGLTGTKYLNFGKTRTGFIVTPAVTAALQSFNITTANDAPGRDPINYEIYGTNVSPIVSQAHSRGDSEAWTLVATGDLALPEDRLTASPTVNIANNTSYTSYKVIFPTVKDEAGANSMQIADVAFYSGPDLTGQSMLTVNDFIIPIRDVVATTSPPESRSPDNGNENAPNAIDRNTATKYLNFGKLDSGVIVTPSIGASVATGFKITTANDAPERDPTSYAIYGTNEEITTQPHGYGNENNWVLISQGAITPPDDRFTESQEVTFANTEAYTSYRITFPTLRDANAANSMQVAEIQLTSANPATLVINRQTGQVRIRAEENVTFSAYDIISAVTQGLDVDAWNSIASTNADPDDAWTETLVTMAQLSEEDLPAGANNGITLTAGNSLILGDLWQSLPSSFEDVDFQLYGLAGNLISDGVEFEGTEIILGDYSGNGTVGAEDWAAFRAGLGGQYHGLSRSEAYLGGDLDGDFDSDIYDFNLFVELAGGAAALFGTHQVPEPSSIAILLGAVVGGLGLRFRNRSFFRPAAILVVGTIAVTATGLAAAQTFTNVGGAPVTATSPDPNEAGNAGPINWFDDDFLDDPFLMPINEELFLLDYNDPELEGGPFLQYAGMGAAPKTVFLDYGSPVSANWFAYSQRSGADPTADRVGMFEFWFSNSPFNDTLPNTPPDSVVKISPDDERLFDSTLRPYTLSGTKTGQYVAIRLTVSEVSAPRPTNNIGGHEFRLLQGPSDVVLEVDRGTGAMTLRNNGPNAQNIEMQAITIESPSGGLNAAGYNGVRGDSGFPLGNGSGNGWEIGLGSNADRIIETYFQGDTTLAAGTAAIPLGNAYNPLSLAEDLTFRWTTNFIYTDPDTFESRFIVKTFDGVVNYVGTAPNITLGDYNNDGAVDARDYVVWRNNFGTTNVMPNDSTPGMVDIDDYERWKANYGGGNPGALDVALNPVPEPHAIVLSLLATVVGATAIRRRLS